MVRRAVLAASFATLTYACVKPAPPSGPREGAKAVPKVAPTLAFVDHTGAQKELALDAMLALSPARTITTRDDQYGKKKRFVAMALSPVLDRVLGKDNVRGNELMLKALDGYVVNIAGARLYDGDAYLAYDDADVPGFEPLGHKQLNPGPFYLIWPKDEQNDLVQWPRPYQLASINIASYAARFPHTIPSSDDVLVQRGFSVFKSLCVHCHAINRQGGRVGPELNVPKNVTEYWSEENLRAYIKDPQTFRYGNMPANPQLEPRDLDGILAYLKHMQTKKAEP